MTGLSIIERLKQGGALTLVHELCDATCVPVDKVLSKDRHKSIKETRHAIWRELHARNRSSSEIARMFGVDHTTVLAAVKRARVRIAIKETP